MNSLVVYYSLEGSTKLIAETISKELKCNILQLKTKNTIPKKGFLKFLWGGKQVVFNEKPELETFDEDFNKYDLIIIGSPVWAGSYVPAFNTFFSKVELSNRKIALFACYGGSEGKIFNEFKKQLEGNNIIGQVSFKDPIKNDTQKNIEDLKQWVDKLVKENF